MTTIEIASNLALDADYMGGGTFALLAKPQQIAWAAGLFEGEGCISHDEQKRGRRRMLTLASTDRDVLERFAAVVEAGTIRVKRPTVATHKAQWRWELRRWREVERVLRMFLPYLGERRLAKALELLADPAARQGDHCAKGHPLRGPGADVYKRKDRSSVQCAPCARERSRKAEKGARRLAPEFREAIEA